jgi:hypothetical protein
MRVNTYLNIFHYTCAFVSGQSTLIATAFACTCVIYYLFMYSIVLLHPKQYSYVAAVSGTQAKIYERMQFPR